MICYTDTIKMYRVSPDEYGNDKVVEEIDSVPCIFMQSTGFSHSSFQDSTDSDSTIFIDPKNQFIIDNAYRLEGMYVLAQMFGSSSDESWYKVTAVAVNRDIIGCKNIDNVELAVKKTRPLQGMIS